MLYVRKWLILPPNTLIALEIQLPVVHLSVVLKFAELFVAAFG